MREMTVPPIVAIDPAANATDAVFRNAEDNPGGVAFLRRAGTGWQPVSAKEFAAHVRALAAGLIAAGIQAGDRIGLMSHTRYEWTLADYAIWTAGAVPVPIYETSSAEQVSWILADSGARAVIVESADHTGLIAGVRDRPGAELDGLAFHWQIDAGDLDRLAREGEAVNGAAVEDRRRALTAEGLATIIYTSGTTGRPKGCELTHANLVGTARTVTSMLPELFGAQDSTLLFLPLAHVFGRLIQIGCVESGITLGHTADTKNLLADLATFRPTFILSVPRVFEKVYNGARQQAHAGSFALPRRADLRAPGPFLHRTLGAVRGLIFDQAEATAVAWSQASEAGVVPPGLERRHQVFDRLVYAKLRAALGGKVRYAASGGAPLGARLGHFFRGVGVGVLEGYGLTETAAGGTLNTPAQLRIGSVGRPLPGTSVHIAEDGEILLGGFTIFRGYWHNPTASSEALDSAGLFHTGDIGELDADGFLTITGRKKELIVTAGGKNVAPAVLEDRLRAHPLVSQCLVVGDQQPFIAALVTIDPEALPTWLHEHGRPATTPMSALVEDRQLRADIERAVEEANQAVSKAEAIRKFTILPVDFTEAGGQLTPTLKVKRSVVLTEFAGAVDSLYH